MPVSSIVDEIARGVEFPIQENNLDSITTHLNLTFEGLEEVDVQLTGGILDPRKHSTYKENPKSTKHTKGRRFESLGTSSSGNKDWKINGKIGIAQGGKKYNISLWGLGSRFKASMEGMVNLISTNMVIETGMRVQDEMNPNNVTISQQ